MWPDISVHDPFGVAIVQSLSNMVNVSSLMVQGVNAHSEKLEHVISDVVIGEPRVEHFEVDVVNVLRDQAWNLGSRIANHVQQGYDIRTSGQVLQNLDFSFDLLLLDGLEDFDDTFFAVDDVNALEHLFNQSCRCQYLFPRSEGR